MPGWDPSSHTLNLGRGTESTELLRASAKGGHRLRACGGGRLQPGPEGDAGPEGLLTVTSRGVLPCAQLEIPLWNVLESPRKVAGK